MRMEKSPKNIFSQLVVGWCFTRVQSVKKSPKKQIQESRYILGVAPSQQHGEMNIYTDPLLKLQ